VPNLLSKIVKKGLSQKCLASTRNTNVFTDLDVVPDTFETAPFAILLERVLSFKASMKEHLRVAGASSVFQTKDEARFPKQSC